MVILMYHAFGGPGERPSRFVVHARRFSRQMALLKWLRYEVLSLEEYLRCRREGRRLPARSVVITIDDGYADNRSVAYPVLERHGYSATIFLVVDRVGGVNDWTDDGALARRELLSWKDVQEMLRAGIQFGAHTRTHPRLSALSPEAARREIIGSQVELARVTGAPIRLFAYPYGDCDARDQSIVAQAGFWGSCGTQSGRNSPETPLHNLRRTEICGSDNLVAFALKLRSGDSSARARRNGTSKPRWHWRRLRQRLLGARPLQTPS